MSKSVINVCLSNGQIFRIEGQDDDDQTRAQTNEWAARHIVRGDAGADPDILELTGPGQARAHLRRSAIASVIIEDMKHEYRKAGVWVLA